MSRALAFVLLVAVAVLSCAEPTVAPETVEDMTVRSVYDEGTESLGNVTIHFWRSATSGPIAAPPFEEGGEGEAP
jgi:hypothetical protein